MLLLRDLLKGNSSDSLIVLVRPLGRKPGDYAGLARQFKSVAGEEIPQAPDDGRRTAHCELFIQISASQSDVITCCLRSWVENHTETYGFFCHSNPVWYPFQEEVARCTYARSLRERDQKYVSSLPSPVLAAFLKMIWQRASKTIADRIVAWGEFRPIDPTSQPSAVLEFMEASLSDICPKDYGIAYPAEVIDPTPFGVAHMVAFAVNALTQAQGPLKYQVEQYLPVLQDVVSWPCRFESRSGFIDRLRSCIDDAREDP